MLTRQDPKQKIRDTIFKSVPGDFESIPRIAMRARVSQKVTNDALVEFQAAGLVEADEDHAGRTSYRRPGATYCRPLAERMYLGFVLRHEEKAVAILQTLTRGHFWDDQCREVFETARWLADNDKCPTLENVLYVLQSMGRETHAGGVKFVRNLVEQKGNFEKVSKVLNTAHDQRLMRQTRGLWKNAPSIKRLFDDDIETLRRRARGEEKPVPLPIASIEKALGGGLPEGVHALTAGTGFGKTTLVLMIVLHAALEGIPVLYLGLEAKRAEVTARLLGLLSGKRWSDLLRGRDPEGLEEAIRDHGETLRGLPINIETASPYGWPAGLLYERAAALRAKHPEQETNNRPVLVVLDFLQLVAGDGDRPEDPRLRISRATYGAAAVARDFHAAVLMVSSVPRSSYEQVNLTRGQGKGSEPDLEMLGDPERLVGLGKESGEIEYSADTMMALVRVREPNERGIPDGGATVWLAIAKQRTGGPCWIPLRFDGSKYWEPEVDDLEADVGDLDDDGDGDAVAAKNPFEDIA